MTFLNQGDIKNEKLYFLVSELSIYLFSFVKLISFFKIEYSLSE